MPWGAPQFAAGRSRCRFDGRARARVAARARLLGHGAAVGDAIAQHADARHGVRVPGQCLVEATNLSEGRVHDSARSSSRARRSSTAIELAARLDGMKLPGVQFRPVSFRPMFHKFAGRSCGGVQFHVTLCRAAFRRLRRGARVPRTAARAEGAAGADFRGRRLSTSARLRVRRRSSARDRSALTGSDVARRGIEAGASVHESSPPASSSSRKAFADHRRPHLLPEYS